MPGVANRTNVFINVRDDADADLTEVTARNPMPTYQPLGASLPAYNAKYIATQTTLILKTTAGVLHSITLNTPVASGVISVYDDVSAVAANLIAVITLPGTLLNNGPLTALYDATLTRGLTVVTSGANAVWTVAYA